MRTGRYRRRSRRRIPAPGAAAEALRLRIGRRQDSPRTSRRIGPRAVRTVPISACRLSLSVRVVSSVEVGVGFDCVDLGWSGVSDDKDVVCLFSGDVNADARQGVTTRPTFSLPRKTTLGSCALASRSTCSASCASGGELPKCARIRTRRPARGSNPFSKGLDDCLDIVRFALLDPPLLACVSLSFRDDGHGRDVFLEGGTVLDGPDEGGFGEIRSIEWDDERHTSSPPLINSFVGQYSSGGDPFTSLAGTAGPIPVRGRSAGRRKRALSFQQQTRVRSVKQYYW